METFTKGVHRCPILQDGHVVGVVSQSDIMSYLAQTVSTSATEKAKFSATLTSLGIIARNPISIKGDERVRDALRLIRENAVDSVPVVDSNNGCVLGSISISCLRGVATIAELTSLMEQTALQFLSKDRDALAKSVAIKEELSLGEAILAVSENRCHRLIIIDKKGALVGLVTLSDLIRAVMKVLSLALPVRRNSINP